MDNDGERLILTGIGPVIALAMAIALIPLRGYTSASNLTFLFLLLTIIVAEYGGRWAAVATALVSALSLDFFLTQPYLHLVIWGKNDVLAFIGLAVCGLVAAALGSNRAERAAERRAGRKHRALLDSAFAELVSAGAIDIRAAELLNASLAALPLTAIALRDSRNGIVAAKPAARPVPEHVLQPETLLLPGESAGELKSGDLPLPGDGGRIALMDGGRHVGWLDVWGGEAAASADARRTLANVGRAAAVLLAGRE